MLHVTSTCTCGIYEPEGPGCSDVSVIIVDIKWVDLCYVAFTHCNSATTGNSGWACNDEAVEFTANGKHYYEF